MDRKNIVNDIGIFQKPFTDTKIYLNFIRVIQASQRSKSEVQWRQTLAASATMSGSSTAVTSFNAGRELATRTTCKHMPIEIFRYNIKVRSKEPSDWEAAEMIDRKILIFHFIIHWGRERNSLPFHAEGAHVPREASLEQHQHLNYPQTAKLFCVE